MSQRTKTIIVFELFSTKNVSGHIEFDFGEHSDQILLELGSNWEQGEKEVLRSKFSSKHSISKKNSSGKILFSFGKPAEIFLLPVWKQTCLLLSVVEQNNSVAT